ncbi:hypothetical protein ACS0TY_035059 [Phlomoides rotata]
MGPALVVGSRPLEATIDNNQRKVSTNQFLGFDCSLEGGGRRGGLTLLWHSDDDVEVVSYSSNHFDAVIHDGGDVGDWRFTGVYGWPDDQQKWKTWRMIDYLANGNSLPWLCLGDFNEILFDYEKRGGLRRRESKMAEFRGCLERNGLLDLGAGHSFYTWINKQHGRSNIQERLDRAVATQGWMDLFPCARVSHLPRILSDHNPVEEAQCRGVVEESWRGLDGSSTELVAGKLEACGNSLKSWGNAHFSDIPNQIKGLEEQLGSVQLRPPSEENVALAWTIENKIAALLRKEELHWLQRSRICWMRDGDKNTKYFHKTASGRRRRNKIECITDCHGMVWDDEEEIARVFTDHFKVLFTTGGLLNMSEAVDAVEHKITSEMETTLRFVDVDPICKRCGVEVETMEHTLRDCKWAADFWLASVLRLDTRPAASSNTSLKDWVLGTIATLQESDHLMFVTLLWFIWFARNKLYFEDKAFAAPYVHTKGLSYMDDFRKASINVDAAVRASGLVGIGGAVRNADGLMCWCFAECVRGRLEVDVAEAMAALRGIKLAAEKEVRHLWVETDSQLLYHALTSPKPDISLFGSLVHDILALKESFGGLNLVGFAVREILLLILLLP